MTLQLKKPVVPVMLEHKGLDTESSNITAQLETPVFQVVTVKERQDIQEPV